MRSLLCHGCLIHFVSYVSNAIHAPLFAMKLEKIPVNDKITASCQTKYVSQTSYQWLQTTKTNFEKLLGEQFFKNHNYNPFHYSSSFSIPASHSICCVIYTFFGYFDDSLNFSGCNSHCLSFDTEFRDTAHLTFLLVNAINVQGPCADQGSSF